MNYKRKVIAALIMAISPIAMADSLSPVDLEKIRSVLRGLNIEDRDFSDKQLQEIQREGRLLINAEDLKSLVSDRNAGATCGTGSHGGGSSGGTAGH